MDWQQKLYAMQALCGGICAHGILFLRCPGDWGCRLPGAIGGDGLLTSTCGGGSTPEEAVNDAWEQIESLPSDRFLVVERAGERKHYHWNKFMWEELPQ